MADDGWGSDQVVHVDPVSTAVAFGVPRPLPEGLTRGRFLLERLWCAVAGHRVDTPSGLWHGMPLYVCGRCWLGMPDLDRAFPMRDTPGDTPTSAEGPGSS